MKLIVKMRSFDEKVSKCKQVTSSPELSRSAQAIVMRNYRARLKEDPLKYQLYCQSESHRSWIIRRQLTDEQKRKYTQKSKLRMRRLRERRKAEKNENHKAELVIETKSTQLKKEKQRQHWRMQKHAHRAKMSSEEFKRDKYLSKTANEEVPSSPKLSRSARAIVMRNYRAKLKEDPQKYQLHRQLESHRSRLHRRQFSEEQKRKYNEKSKLRMRRLRERRKAEENENHNSAELGIETKSTQLKEEEQRQCRRMKRQVPRAGTSSEEKRLVQEKMLRSIADESSSSEQEGSDSEDARAARRKATSMVKTVIPSLSADHYAKVVASLINIASPEQLTALRKHLVTI